MSAQNLVYVMPLNKAVVGPCTVDEAVETVKKHQYINATDSTLLREGVEAGEPGPWHFSYGFMSVTVQREAPMPSFVSSKSTG